MPFAEPLIFRQAHEKRASCFFIEFVVDQGHDLGIVTGHTAAALPRCRCSRRSRTSPSSSTARQSQNCSPAMITAISSRCQRKVGRGRPARKFLREPRPKLQDPSSHRLVGDIQPALSQHIGHLRSTATEVARCREMYRG